MRYDGPMAKKTYCMLASNKIDRDARDCHVGLNGNDMWNEPDAQSGA